MSTPIPFENPMLLVEELKLNAVCVPTVKARAGSRAVTPDNGPSINISGPSLFFTWWPQYGPPPAPGDWLELEATVHKAEEIFADDGKSKSGLARTDAKGGERYTRLVDIAGHMRRLGLDPKDIWSIIHNRNANFEEPLPQTEIDHIYDLICTVEA